MLIVAFLELLPGLKGQVDNCLCVAFLNQLQSEENPQGIDCVLIAPFRAGKLQPLLLQVFLIRNIDQVNIFLTERVKQILEILPLAPLDARRHFKHRRRWLDPYSLLRHNFFPLTFPLKFSVPLLSFPNLIH